VCSAIKLQLPKESAVIAQDSCVAAQRILLVRTHSILVRVDFA
jgi:hypothetical protein